MTRRGIPAKGRTFCQMARGGAVLQGGESGGYPEARYYGGRGWRSGAAPPPPPARGGRSGGMCCPGLTLHARWLVCDAVELERGAVRVIQPQPVAAGYRRYAERIWQPAGWLPNWEFFFHI